MEIRQVLPTNAEVRELIEQLNQYQIGLYGIEACNLEAPEALEKNNAFMLGAFSESRLVGIGAIKAMQDYAEIKRMFVSRQFRGQGVAEKILSRLEAYAETQGITRIFLETGNMHHAAIKFYKRVGYRPVESFGNYRPNTVSIYFGKVLPAM